jgi:hypothetical protein
MSCARLTCQLVTPFVPIDTRRYFGSSDHLGVGCSSDTACTMSDAESDSASAVDEVSMDDIGWTCLVKEVHHIRVEVRGEKKAMWTIKCGGADKRVRTSVATIDGSRFLRISGREKGVANILGVVTASDDLMADHQGVKTFVVSPGLQRLKELRNEAQRQALLPASSLAFRGAAPDDDQPKAGDDAPESKATTWKRQKVSDAEKDSLDVALPLSVGDFTLTVARPMQQNSPLWIKADTANFRAFFAAMADFGVSFKRRAPKDDDAADGDDDAGGGDDAAGAACSSEPAENISSSTSVGRWK